MRNALMQGLLVAGAVHLAACGAATHGGPKSESKSKASCTVTRSGDSYTTVFTGGQPSFLYLVEVGGVNDPLHNFSWQVSEQDGTASYTGIWYENTEIKVRWSEYTHVNAAVATCSVQ